MKSAVSSSNLVLEHGAVVVKHAAAVRGVNQKATRIARMVDVVNSRREEGREAFEVGEEEIWAGVLRGMNTDDIIDRRALVACHLVSRAFLLIACPVLWSAAEMDGRGRIQLRNWDGFQTAKVVDVNREALRDGGMEDAEGKLKWAGGVGWRWRAYLASIRALRIVVVSRVGTAEARGRG
ncbi:hypothetical protein HK101_009952 [Irineochytrium annulatum]|nr:hypothetical protein HK101_009952 [Irineochytrium annulatum]